MKAYSYCSYEGSNCGFVLGVLNTKDKDPMLSKDNVPAFIANAFYCGIVDLVFGAIPGQDHWLVMVKNLNAREQKPDIYLNLAFETDAREEYMALLGMTLYGYRNIPGLAGRLSAMVVPRGDDTTFGLSLDALKLAEFIDQCKSEKRRVPTECQADNRLFLYRKTLPDTANKNRSRQLMQELRPGLGYVVIHDSQRHRHVMGHGYDMALSIKDRLFDSVQKIYGDIVD